MNKWSKDLILLDSSNIAMIFNNMSNIEGRKLFNNTSADASKK